MSLYVDRKYASLISLSLDRFTQKSMTVWNARCPYCGDSHRSKIKKRLYIYEKQGRLWFHCHNCSTSGSLSRLIKFVNPSLYQDYLMETIQEDGFGGISNKEEKVPKMDEDFIKSSTPTFTLSDIDLPTIASLDDEHPAKIYLQKRLIPERFLEKLYYTDDFSKFVNEINPFNEKQIPGNHKSIVIPFRDRNKSLLGFQARAIYNTDIRYITYKLDDDNPKIFGLDEVDPSKRVYVVEGPFDSMFLENAVASMDATLYSVDSLLTDIGVTDRVYVNDNEPRNRDILHIMNKTVEKSLTTPGLSVAIWPSWITGKDINDICLGGMTSSETQTVIDDHTYSGLEAKLKFIEFKKV